MIWYTLYLADDGVCLTVHLSLNPLNPMGPPSVSVYTNSTCKTDIPVQRHFSNW